LETAFNWREHLVGEGIYLGRVFNWRGRLIGDGISLETHFIGCYMTLFSELEMTLFNLVADTSNSLNSTRLLFLDTENDK